MQEIEHPNYLINSRHYSCHSSNSAVTTKYPSGIFFCQNMAIIMAKFFFLFYIAISTGWITLPQVGASGSIQNKLNGTFADWVITYHHPDGKNYYLVNNQGMSEVKLRSRFTLELEDQLEDIVCIKNSMNNQYLSMSPQGQLVTTDAFKKAYFRLVPILDSPTSSFYIYITPDIPIVSLTSDEPFDFYNMSRYPFEPSAKFSLSNYEFDIDEFYGGNRTNIPPTAHLIHDSQLIENKTKAYERLLDLMELNEHIWNGSEIFTLGNYIWKLGVIGQDLFKRLPNQVQLISSGEPVQLFYQRNNTIIPMKYNWASRLHENNLGYIFTERDIPGTWGISYSDYHQLYIAFELDQSYYTLLEAVTPLPGNNIRFTFQPHLLTPEIEGFVLHSSVSNSPSFFLPLWTRDQGPSYYFYRANLVDPPALFIVKKY